MINEEEEKEIQIEESQNVERTFETEEKEREWSEDNVRELIRTRNRKIFILRHPASEASNLIITITAGENLGWAFINLVQKQYDSRQLEQQYQDKNAECIRLNEELKRLRGEEDQLGIGMRLENKLEETKNTILANTPITWHTPVVVFFEMIAFISFILGIIHKVRKELKDKIDKREQEQTEEIKKNLDDMLEEVKKIKPNIDRRHTPKKYLSPEDDKN